MFLPYKNTYFSTVLQCTIHPLHEGEGPGVKKEEGRVSAKTDLDLTSISIAATITDIAVYFPSCFIDSMFITVANNEDFGKNPKSFFFLLALGTKNTGKILRLGSVLFLSLRHQGREQVRLNTNKKW